MTNSLQPLLDQLQKTAGPVLWLADESNAAALTSLAHYGPQLTLVSNRYDLAAAAKQLNINAHFSDFDFSFLYNRLHKLPAQQQPGQVFYRISKERPVVNHIINSVFELLPPGGRLWLTGQKTEGIKTYFSQACKLFGCNNRLQKLGNVYWGQLEKNALSGERLNDRDYTQLRRIKPADGEEFFSKPGTYGWDKIDQGSAFLITHISEILENTPASDLRFLDLGCGYGYLTLQCRKFGFATMTGTDNNAAAIRCAQANMDHFAVPATIVADDCGATLQGPYDLILCNPPFHQGFSVEGALTDKFLKNTLRLLASGGHAYFVVNVFIPLESKASDLSGNLLPKNLLPGKREHHTVSVIANNGRFKIIEIKKR